MGKTNLHLYSDGVLRSLIKEHGKAPKVKNNNLLGRMLSKVHGVADSLIIGEIFAPITSMERVIDRPVVYSIYYTRGRKRFDNETLALNSTRVGIVYEVIIYSDDSITRKKV